jgi:hypothetical protein
VVFLTHSRWGRLSATQKADLWSRWKAGQSLHEIGRALDKEHAVIHFLLARHGGIAPAAPAFVADTHVGGALRLITSAELFSALQSPR